MNKSLATTLLSLGLIGAAYLSPYFREQLLDVGLFALSGAVTNWLAIHMLFEKVPGLYGSGVVPARFEEFKGGISRLIMQQFFTRENVENFFATHRETSGHLIDPGPIVEAIDYDHLYDSFTEVVLGSSFGTVLGFVGGAKVLTPLREPFKRKMREEVQSILSSPDFLHAVQSGFKRSHLADDILEKVEQIVARRLDELTPDMVKTIVQDMIRQHLGWLVVWGGVFGGLIGLAASLASIR